MAIGIALTVYTAAEVTVSLKRVGADTNSFIIDMTGMATNMAAANFTVNNVTITNSLTIGGVTLNTNNFRRIIKTNVNINVPLIGLLTRQTATTTVNGAVPGDVVSVSFVTAMPFGLTPQNWRISASNTLEIAFQNILTLSGIGAATYNLDVGVIQ